MNIFEIEINYQIYPDGRIWSDKKDDFLKIQQCRAGYYRVGLCFSGKRKVFSIHRLVAMKYVNGKTLNKSEVNHIDGDKSNNHFNNLEWVTRKENMQHAHKTGLIDYSKRTLVTRNKALNELYSIGWSKVDLSDAFGITVTRVIAIIKNR